MTLERYNALQRFWSKWPPTQILLAHYVGYKTAAKEEQPAASGEELSAEDMAALQEMFGPLPMRTKGKGNDGQD